MAILAATESATTVLQMTSMVGMTAVMVAACWRWSTPWTKKWRSANYTSTHGRARAPRARLHGTRSERTVKRGAKRSYEPMGPLSVLLGVHLGASHRSSLEGPGGEGRARRVRGPETAAPSRAFEPPPLIRKYNSPIVLLRNALKSTIRP